MARSRAFCFSVLVFSGLILLTHCFLGLVAAGRFHKYCIRARYAAAEGESRGSSSRGRCPLLAPLLKVKGKCPWFSFVGLCRGTTRNTFVKAVIGEVQEEGSSPV